MFDEWADASDSQRLSETYTIVLLIGGESANIVGIPQGQIRADLGFFGHFVLN